MSQNISNDEKKEEAGVSLGFHGDLTQLISRGFRSFDLLDVALSKDPQPSRGVGRFL